MQSSNELIGYAISVVSLLAVLAVLVVGSMQLLRKLRAWTIYRRVVAEEEAKRGRETHVTGLAAIGYVCAILIPVAGIVIGAILYDRNRHGLPIAVLGVCISLLTLGALVALSLYGAPR